MNKAFNKTLTLPSYSNKKSFPAVNLPAPHWSPNGKEGYWVWRDEKWRWLTDEEYDKLKVEENE